MMVCVFIMEIIKNHANNISDKVPVFILFSNIRRCSMKQKWYAVSVLVMMLWASTAGAVTGDIDQLNSLDLKDAVLALKVAGGLEAPGVFVAGDVNSDTKIGIEEAIFVLQVLAQLRDVPVEITNGTVNMPTNYSSSEIVVTNFSDSSSVDENTAFTLTGTGLTVAAKKSDNNLIYICYSAKGEDAVMNAKETALALILKFMPFEISLDDPKLTSLKDLIYAVPEVQTLETAIQNTVETIGYLDISAFAGELDTAFAAVGVQFSLIKASDLAAVEKRNAETGAGMVFPANVVEDGPRKRYLASTDSDFYRNIKIDILDSTFVENGVYDFDIQVFSKSPIVLGLTRGERIGDDGFAIIPDSTIYFIPPMGSSDFLDTFTTVDGVTNYLSDSYDFATSGISFNEMTWNSVSLSIPNFRMSCCNDVWVIAGNNHPKVVMANVVFQILRGVKLIGGTSGKEILDYLTSTPSIVNQCIIYVEKRDYKGLTGYLSEQIVNYINQKVTDVLVKDASDKFLEITTQIAGTTANALDFATAPLYMSNTKPDIAFSPRTRCRQPVITEFTVTPTEINIGDPLLINFKYCDSEGLDDTGTIYILTAIPDNNGSNDIFDGKMFPTDSSGEFTYALPTDSLPSSDYILIWPKVLIHNKTTTSPTKQITLKDAAMSSPALSNFEIPQQVDLNQPFNIRFQYDDPDGYADIVEFIIESTDYQYNPPVSVKNAADSGRQFDLFAQTGQYYKFPHIGIGVYVITITAVDSQGNRTHSPPYFVNVANPMDVDDDGDGYTEQQGDCNDNNAWVYPGATEICGDLVDQNCDSQADEGCVPVVPEIPANVNAVPGDGRATLTWDALGTGTYYHIYQSRTPGVTASDYEVKYTVGKNSALIALQNGTMYYFAVSAFNSAGESDISVEMSVMPDVTGITKMQNRIAAGSSHTVALKSDGTVWAWGDNYYGQLGVGTEKDRRPTPVQVAGLTGVAAVAAGYDHTVALKTDGTVWAWGNYESTPVQVAGLAGVAAISAGTYHTVALKTDGTVWAWGSRLLGDGTSAGSSTPVQAAGLTGVSAVAAGYDHTVALKTDGTLWAWGQNDNGQLGDGTTANNRTPVQVVGLTKVAAISADYDHTVALKTDGTVWAWGDNHAGRLGDGTTEVRRAPVQVAGLTGVAAISTGFNHTVTMKTDGTVWAWGYNEDGKLGDGTTVDRPTPVQTAGLTNMAAIAAGDFYTVALKTDGTVWAWGANGSSGRLGDGTTVDRLTPIQVAGLTGVAAIAVGDDHAVALKTDGTVWAWGDNEDGKIGDGTTVERRTPVQVAGLTNVAAIAAGYYHTVALKTDGTVWAWGNNYAGRLGDGTTEDRLTPVQVTGLTSVAAIAAGCDYTVALKTDGTVWAWGSNYCGQLGDGTTEDRLTPVQSAGLTGVAAVAAGCGHVVALKIDGTVWAWGLNREGQLGDGTTADRLTPVQVAGLTGVAAIAASPYHTVVLKTDGTVWAWGENWEGQLGDGTREDRLTPVQPAGLTGVAAVAAGGRHTVALKTDGSVWAWGDNDNGQLGCEYIVQTKGPGGDGFLNLLEITP